MDELASSRLRGMTGPGHRSSDSASDVRWWEIVLVAAGATWAAAFVMQWGLLYLTAGTDDRMVILYPVGLALNGLAVVAGLVGLTGSFFGGGRRSPHVWAIRVATVVGVLVSPALLWFGGAPLNLLGIWPR